MTSVDITGYRARFPDFPVLTRPRKTRLHLSFNFNLLFSCRFEKKCSSRDDDRACKSQLVTLKFTFMLHTNHLLVFGCLFCGSCTYTLPYPVKPQCLHSGDCPKLSDLPSITGRKVQDLVKFHLVTNNF
jgi:hypothetical protein